MTHRSGWMLGGIVCAALLAIFLPALVLAATEGGDHSGGGGLINLDKSLFVQIVNFVILLVILHRLLYKPLVAKMNERTEAIRRSLEEAQSARAEAARQQEENAARLRAAHQEAAQIRDHALREAAEESRKQMEAAQAQARRLVEDARAQMGAEVRQARDALRREVAELSTAVAEKLIRKSLRDEDHRRIVAEAVGRLGN
ncbi:MAG: F0F1 ATP synthase subunit B [Candidatus Rokubacteria bacterium]|nr:F0F1 ATP synthase subunit B [Candidatus Rokubacteria bacterium]